MHDSKVMAESSNRLIRPKLLCLAPGNRETTFKMQSLISQPASVCTVLYDGVVKHRLPGYDEHLRQSAFISNIDYAAKVQLQ